MTFANQAVFPITADSNDKDHLTLGGIDVLDLVAEYGSPLYVYDEKTLRGMCRTFIDEFTSRYRLSLIHISEPTRPY